MTLKHIYKTPNIQHAPLPPEESVAALRLLSFTVPALLHIVYLYWSDIVMMQRAIGLKNNKGPILLKPIASL
jgi:hypothetical protein